MQEQFSGENNHDWHPAESPRKITWDEVMENADKYVSQGKTEELDPGYEEKVRKQFEENKRTDYRTNKQFGLEEDIPPTIFQPAEIPDTIPQLEENPYATNPDLYSSELAFASADELKQLSDKHGVDFFNQVFTDKDMTHVSKTTLTKAVIQLGNLDRSLDKMTREEVIRLSETYPGFNAAKIDSLYQLNSKFLRQKSGEIKLQGD